MVNADAVRLGKLGGKAKAKKYSHEHYVNLGKLGMSKRWNKSKASKPRKS